MPRVPPANLVLPTSDAAAAAAVSSTADVDQSGSRHGIDEFIPSKEPVSAKNFEMISELGAGSGGTVWRVRYKPTGQCVLNVGSKIDVKNKFAQIFSFL